MSDFSVETKQDAAVRTEYGEKECFGNGKGIRQ